jgi:hypothetical protein
VSLIPGLLRGLSNFEADTADFWTSDSFCTEVKVVLESSTTVVEEPAKERMNGTKSSAGELLLLCGIAAGLT